jgi:cell division protein FtsW (lipid II flippase)
MEDYLNSSYDVESPKSNISSDYLDNLKCGYFVPINKTGSFSIYDKINIGLIIIFLIIYFILISIYPYSKSDLSNNDNDSNKNTKQIVISIIGLALSIFIASFISDYVLREYKPNNIILGIVTILAIILIMFYYVSMYIDNKSNGWLYLNHTIFPLLGSAFLIIQYTYSILYHYHSKSSQ